MLAACGQASGGVAVAALNASDLPTRPVAAPLSGAGFAAAGATDGQTAIAGETLAEGRAGGKLKAGGKLGRDAPALASAYLGDVAVAYLQPGSGIRLRMQRHFQHRFSPPSTIAPVRSAVGDLTVALDYRTDAMVLWWQGGWLWARERHANGPLASLQRFARASAGVQLTALISDDGRAIVAWLDPRGRGRATVKLAISGPGMRLRSAMTVERLRWPSGESPPGPGAVRLVRLSTESVLLAWTGTQGGHFVVRAAGVDLQGLRARSLLSGTREDAVLEALATGPAADAVAAWSRRLPSGRAGLGATAAIVAARGVPSSRGAPRFGAPQQVAGAAHHGPVALAVDPGSDRALAVWREADGRVRYSVREAPRA